MSCPINYDYDNCSSKEYGHTCDTCFHNSGITILITDSMPNFWYKDAIEKEFDAQLRIHPTFKNLEYILLNTERNKKYFAEDELSLLVLKSGHYGVAYEHAVSNKK